MDILAAVYLFIIFFILAWAVDYLPFLKIARSISSLSRTSLETIQSTSVDDEVKQKVLLGNSLGMLRESMKIIFFMTVLVGILFLWLLLGDYIKPLSYDSLTEYLVTYSGIVLSIVAFLSYFLLKKLYVRFRV